MRVEAGRDGHRTADREVLRLIIRVTVLDAAENVLREEGVHTSAGGPADMGVGVGDYSVTDFGAGHGNARRSIQQERIERRPAQPGKAILTVQDLSARNDKGMLALKHLNLMVREKEVVGIANISSRNETNTWASISRPLSSFDRQPNSKFRFDK